MARPSPARHAVWVFALALSGTACTGPDSSADRDPLPSWTDGAARTAILEFVARVTDPDSPGFVLPPDRVAVFDNDGTLIIERPLVQMEFVFDRVRALAADHPEWAENSAFQAVLTNDQQALGAMSFRGRGALVNAAQGNVSQPDLRAAMSQFLATARHPRFDRPYPELVYQPMLELLGYLAARDFRVYVVSSGGIEFIRQFAEDVYGIPRERVIGSVMKYDLREVDGRLEVWRKPGFQGLNAGRFKALNIDRHIGRRPILAVGNSDGDLEMLGYTDSADGSLAILLHHDDAAREYVYDTDAERALAAAQERGWLVVSMAKDFDRLFPGDL